MPGLDGQKCQCRILTPKARIGSHTIPRQEIIALVIVTRPVTALWNGFMEPPAYVMPLVDSTCMIISLECDQRVLAPFFSSRCAEILDHMKLWERDTKVYPVHYVTAADIQLDSQWQTRPPFLQYDMDTWPVHRDFVREVPQEERILKVFAAVVARVVAQRNYNDKVLEVLNSHKHYLTAKRIIVRMILASIFGHIKDEVGNKSLVEEISLKSLDLSHKMSLASAMEASLAAEKAGKLRSLLPIERDGLLVTEGRLARGLKAQLGKEALPILMPDTRIAYLIMVQANEEDHKGFKITLARSRSQAWIHRAMPLAKRVCSECAGEGSAGAAHGSLS